MCIQPFEAPQQTSWRLYMYVLHSFAGTHIASKQNLWMKHQHAGTQCNHKQWTIPEGVQNMKSREYVNICTHVLLPERCRTGMTYCCWVEEKGPSLSMVLTFVLGPAETDIVDHSLLHVVAFPLGWQHNILDMNKVHLARSTFGIQQLCKINLSFHVNTWKCVETDLALHLLFTWHTDTR